MTPKPKPSFFSLQNLAAKLHPPLPITSRESDQLLHLFKKSYQDQLNVKHPESSQDNFRATDQHFQQVLSSPLMTKTRQHDALISGSTQLKDFEILRPSRTVREHTIPTVEDILHILDHGVNTTSAAKSTVGVGMTIASDAVPRLIAWLKQCNQDVKTKFFAQPRLSKLLVPLIAVRSQEAAFWELLDVAHESMLADSPHDRTSVMTKLRFQSLMIQSCVVNHLRHADLNSTYEFLSSAMTHLINRANPLKDAQYWPRLILRRATRKFALTLVEGDKASVLRDEYYDAFLESTSIWDRTLYHKALLCLHHPRQPTVSTALEFLQTLVSESRPKWTSRAQGDFTFLALHTATVLLEEARFDQAQTVIGILRSSLGVDISSYLQEGTTSESTSTEPVNIPRRTALAEVVLWISDVSQSRNRRSTLGGSRMGTELLHDISAVFDQRQHHVVEAQSH